MIRAALCRRCFKRFKSPDRSTLQNYLHLLVAKCGLATQATDLIAETGTQKAPLFISDFSSSSFAAALQQCMQQRDFGKGMSLHCNAIIKRGNGTNLFASNNLINMYVQAGELDDAWKVFDEMPKRNVISFVTLVQGCRRDDRYDEGVRLLSRFHKEGYEMNAFVFTAILKLLVEMEWAEMGSCVHACAYKIGYCGDVFVGSGLIDVYGECGLVGIAREVFDGIGCKDMVAWTGIVTCYAENGCFDKALEMNAEMCRVGLRPNNFSFSSALKACIGLDDVDAGKSIHGCALKVNYQVDHYVGLSLIELYTKCGRVDDAMQVFKEMPEKDVISWTFLIARYSQNERCEEAIDLFQKMRRAQIVPNQFTFSTVLQSCATIQKLNFGKQIHGLVLKVDLDADIFVSNALMDVYAKCGDLESSMEIFTTTENKNDISWNTAIVGHVQFGKLEEGLNLFYDMHMCHIQPTEVTYSIILSAIGGMASLKPGAQIHCRTIKIAFDKDIAVSNSLIDMYARFGNIKDAELVFEEMRMRDGVSWNTMIQAYSLHGMGTDALCIFDRMVETGLKPNKLTFVSLLSACCNSGLLENGQTYFNIMVKDYGIVPCMEHYTCMVWLLGRSGHLDKAMKLIREIPYEPCIMIWQALLGACVIHNNVELGTACAKHILEMDPLDDSAHVLLSSIYASATIWDKATSVMKSMKTRRVKKELGLSWVEIQGTIHYFSVGDTSQSRHEVNQWNSGLSQEGRICI